MQSTFPSVSQGIHVAIIMDGNGRWAVAQGLPRSAGHRAGAEAVRRVVEAAPDLGIGTLSLFAFSSDNWNRPRDEVRILMRLFAEFLRAEARPLAEHGVRISVIGRRERLPADVVAAISAAEARTAEGRRLSLRVAVDYSSRDAIVAAARRLTLFDGPTREGFAHRLAEAQSGWAPDVDLFDPHGRRAAAERLSPLGERLRGAPLHRADVARVRRGGAGRGRRSVPWPRATVRHAFERDHRAVSAVRECVVNFVTVPFTVSRTSPQGARRGRVLAFQAAYADTFDRRDAKGMAAMLTEDATLQNEWGDVVRGRGNMLKKVQMRGGARGRRTSADGPFSASC